jgi:hypothetical protein
MSLNPRAPQFRNSKSPCVVKKSEDSLRVSTPLAYEFPYTLRPIPLPPVQTRYLASPTSVSPYPNRYSPQLRDSPYPNGMFDGRPSEWLPQFTSVMSDHIQRPNPYHPQRQIMPPPGLPIYGRQ